MSGLFPPVGELDADGVLWYAGALRDEANPLLAREHYLGPVLSGRCDLVVVGCRYGDDPVACQVWRPPTSRRLPSDGSWLELSRWCLTPRAGQYAGSRQHRYAVRIIRATLPKARALVSYSDPSQGHDGALYRACNWQWAPTWLRLRPPPSGHGAWIDGVPQSVKDRWVFQIDRHYDMWAQLAINDAGAVRHWAANRSEAEIRWARSHPELREAA